MRQVIFIATLLFAGCNSGDPCADDAEPNDDRGLAPALASGTARGNLRACMGDVDWFNVTLAAGEQLDVHVAIEGAADAVLLSLHEPGGAPIAGALVDGDGPSAHTQPGAAGTYAVRIAGLGERAAYSVIATVSPSAITCDPGTHAQNGACVTDGCEDAGLEPNDDLTTARRIAPGVYHGLRTCEGDSDFYVISAPPGGGALQVSITAIDGADIDVYASDGTMNGPIPNLRGAAQTTGDADYLTNVPIAAGGEMYFFVVGGTSGYDMEVSFTPLDMKRDCMTDCKTIVAFDGPVDASDPAAITAGYYDGSEPRYMFARRDFAMALQWAFAQTALKFPDTHPVYVSDIGQEDGKTPGVDVGDPRHPLDAHINGHDADIAYYQRMPDNDYRIICGDGSDNNGNGQPGKYNDGYFCTTDENVVDMPRHAYFLGMVAENPLYHVTGVDETLPQQIWDAADALAGNGTMDPRVAYKINHGLAYGNIDLWPFHHHHCHVQLWNPDQPRLPLYYDGYF
jgi:hypothetical protein